MILAQNLITKIKDHFNLNVYETKVWLALLSKGVASVGEVASISRVPRSRTYDVLEGLEKKGFAIIRMGKPVKYLGVKPQMILERIKTDIRKEAEEKVQILSKIKETEEFLKLDELYKQGIDPVKKEDISASFRGKTNISNYLKEILRNAQKEVIICTNAEEMRVKSKLFLQTFELLKKSKVKIKVALFGESNLIKDVERQLDIKIKKIEIDSKFFVVDRKEIFFYISRGGEGADDIAIWLNSPFFVESFTSLFEKAIKE